MKYLPIGLSLIGIWIILGDGYHSLVYLLIGINIVALVLYCLEKINFRFTSHNNYYKGLLKKFLSLLINIVCSSWMVTKQIWSLKPQLDPHVTQIKVENMSDLAKVIYANSITITPGTLCIDMNEDNLIIHNLFK